MGNPPRGANIKTGSTNRGRSFDGFGNITDRDRLGTGGGTNHFLVDSGTNRLSGRTYDHAGNIEDLIDPDIEIIYTPFNQPIKLDSPNHGAYNFYNFEGERLCEFEFSDPSDKDFVYILRDHENQPLRRIEVIDQFDWFWEKDYIRMPGRVLAAVTHSDDSGNPESAIKETRHFHLDHLGTPRLTTDENRNKVAREDFLPFGTQILTGGLGYTGERTKFTGHTRDFFAGPATKYDLDYMHARYYSPYLARFLSVDPVGGSVGSSQSWNRYSYALNNPVKYVDPDGREVYLVGRALDMPWYAAPLRAGTHTFVVIAPTGQNIEDMSDRMEEGLLVLGGYQAQRGEPEGMMVGRQNFETDLDVATGRRANRFFQEVQLPNGMTMEEFEVAVVAAFDSYEDDYQYEAYPEVEEGEANCNCFSAGMLQGAGVSLDTLPDNLPLADPGWPDPIPLGGTP